jgi:hypothetical protein
MRVIAIGVAAVVAVTLAGCKRTPSQAPTSHPPVAVSGPTSPAAIRAQAHALRKLEPCMATATGFALTWKVVQGGTGSASIPGTVSPPRVVILHYSPGVLDNIGDSTDVAVACAVPPSIVASVKACEVHLNLPDSEAAMSKYLVNVADCMAAAPQ